MKGTFKLLHAILVLAIAVVGGIIYLFVGEKSNEPYKMVDGTIICKTPKRPKGQQDMLQFAAEPLDTVRVGFIGLGSRGKGGPKRWSQIEGTKIVALCDLKQECIDRAQSYLDKAGRPRAAEYTGSEDAWKQVCERDDYRHCRAHSQALHDARELHLRLLRAHRLEYGSAGCFWRDFAHRRCLYSQPRPLDASHRPHLACGSPTQVQRRCLPYSRPWPIVLGIGYSPWRPI